MTTELRYTSGNLETGNMDIEVAVNSNQETSLNATLDAIAILIQNIDLKHTCDEDYDLYEKSMITILEQVGQSLSYEGWGDEFEGVNGLRTVEWFLKDRIQK